VDVATASVGFGFGIVRAYRLMNRRALDDGAFFVAHQNSGGEWDTLRRIERRDAALLRRYPALEKVSVVHEVAGLGEGARLVLGFHGLPGATKQELARRGVTLLDDLQCPFIARLNSVLERLVTDGFDILIVGRSENHHCREVRQLAAQHGRRCFVIETPEDIEAVPIDGGSLALVGQVTGNTQTFAEAVQRLAAKKVPVKIVKTICGDSYLRQRIAMSLARDADVVILVDDGGGAAESLFEVCAPFGRPVRRVRGKEEIRREWFEGAHKVVVVGGILVPDWALDKIAEHIRTMGS
jgi:4-hydroxy-3-methylbut-2-enyl diphosphate reductase